MAAPAKFLFDMDFSAPDKARERPATPSEIAQRIAAAEGRAYRDGHEAGTGLRRRAARAQHTGRCDHGDRQRSSCACRGALRPALVPALPVETNRFHSAALAPHVVSPRRAMLQHPHVTEREIVLHRIVGIEPSEHLGDFHGSSPARRRPTRETEVTREAMDVDVDGDEEAGGRDIPQARVDTIGGSYHPPQKEEEALRRAPVDRIDQNVLRAVTGRAVELPRVADGSGERAHGALEVIIVVGQGSGERRPERSVVALDGPCSDDEPCEVGAFVHPMFPAQESAADRLRIVGKPSRVRAQAVERILDLGSKGLHVPEGQARGDEPDELLVARVRVEMDEADRIDVTAGEDLPTLAYRVEGCADELEPAVADLPSHARTTVPPPRRCAAP